MNRVSLSKNNAEKSGAVYNNDTLDINESTLSDNLAQKDEAIYNAGSGRLNLDGLTTINSNRAYNGAAIYNVQGAQVMLEGKPYFINNETKDKGGVIYNEGTIILKDAIFVGNGIVAYLQEGMVEEHVN